MNKTPNLKTCENPPYKMSEIPKLRSITAQNPFYTRCGDDSITTSLNTWGPASLATGSQEHLDSATCRVYTGVNSITAISP
jgi:hypothetical protein